MHITRDGLSGGNSIDLPRLLQGKADLEAQIRASEQWVVARYKRRQVIAREKQQLILEEYELGWEDIRAAEARSVLQSRLVALEEEIKWFDQK